MKKVLLTLLAVLFTVVPSFAATYNAASKVPIVGAALLTKNNIPSNNVKFTVVSGDVDNSNYASNKVINVSSADLAYTGNDNEVAAVVANEIGHIISGHASKGKVKNLLQTSSNTNSYNTATSSIISNYTIAKEEKEADIIAADLMVAAGYNPLAIIVVLTKQTGTYWETIQGKPANADRTISLFNYISYAHPTKVKAGYGCAEYRNFLAYANPEIAERKANKKAEAKNTKAQAKAKKNSASQITKFRTRGGLSGWDAAYGLLNSAQQ